ncbi:TPA: hypothetical protein JLG68_001357 [Escherichia coli]|nr:hypothetical protein [Escherichia coli]
MHIQNSQGVTTYEPKEGKEVLNFLLSQGKVANVDTVKTITKVTQYKVLKGRRLFWFLFWLVCFWPMMILVYFFCGHRITESFSDGQFNVTLKDGSRFIIFANEQYVLDWIKSVNQSSFLGTDASSFLQPVADVWSR